MFDIDTHEPQAQSVTATVCEQAALFGATPDRDEFDTRDVWDPDDAIAAVGEAFRIVARGVAPVGTQLADERESLLWGFVNMLDAFVDECAQRCAGMDKNATIAGVIRNPRPFGDAKRIHACAPVYSLVLNTELNSRPAPVQSASWNRPPQSASPGSS